MNTFRFHCALFLSAALLATDSLRAQDSLGQNQPPQEAPPPVVVTPAAPASPSPAAPDANSANIALAEAIRGDLEEVATATSTWAREKKKPVKTKVTLKEITPYLPPDSPVVASGGNDRAGHPVVFGTVESGPRVSSATAAALNTDKEFWGAYAPIVTKQEQGARILADLKQVRLAVLAWDADTPDAHGERATFETVKGYLQPDSDLIAMEGRDRLGNVILLGPAKDPVHVSSDTYKALGLPRDFWGEFAPKVTTTHHVEPERTFGRKVKDFFKGQ